jgi:hypothetical protein
MSPGPIYRGKQLTGATRAILASQHVGKRTEERERT